MSPFFHRFFHLQHLSPSPTWLGKPVADVPMPFGVRDYDQQTKDYIAAAQAIVPDISVFDFGVAATPGISDIDLLCLLPDAISPRVCARLQEIPRGSLFAHPPIMLPKDVRAEIGWLLPISAFRPLTPNAGTIPALVASREQQIVLALFDAFNSALVGWRGLGIVRAEGNLRIRKSMLHIWSARMSMLRAIAGGIADRPEWHRFRKAAEQQRAEWQRDRQIDTDLVVRLLGDAQALLPSVAVAAGNEIAARVCLPANTVPIVGGTSLITSSGPAGRWRDEPFELRFAGRKRRYFRFSVPENVLALLHWRAGAQTQFDHVARRRVSVISARAMLMDRRYSIQTVLSARIVDPVARRLRFRVIDRLALRHVRTFRLEDGIAGARDEGLWQGSKT
jgi:hypothetical protein